MMYGLVVFKQFVVFDCLLLCYDFVFLEKVDFVVYNCQCYCCDYYDIVYDILYVEGCIQEVQVVVEYVDDDDVDNGVFD